MVIVLHSPCFRAVNNILQADILDKSFKISGAYYADVLDTVFSTSKDTTMEQIIASRQCSSSRSCSRARKNSQMKSKDLQRLLYSRDLCRNILTPPLYQKTLRGQPFDPLSEVEHPMPLENDLRSRSNAQVHYYIMYCNSKLKKFNLFISNQ